MKADTLTLAIKTLLPNLVILILKAEIFPLKIEGLVQVMLSVDSSCDVTLRFWTGPDATHYKFNK